MRPHEVGQELLGELAIVFPDLPAGQLQHVWSGRIHHLAGVGHATAAAGMGVSLWYHLIGRLFDREILPLLLLEVVLAVSCADAVLAIGLALELLPVLRDCLNTCRQRTTDRCRQGHGALATI